eukprot:3754034-Karenia_brevis.AAC.1
MQHCFPYGGVATLPAYGYIVRGVISKLRAFLWLVSRVCVRGRVCVRSSESARCAYADTVSH